ncbi:MAG TPA: hypothetical protein VFT87_04950 [Candidatus Saccharimonadales bacterium]|nr:hypothetical protein [Candidatus Saccharimonadales bacterium]
MAVVVPCVTAVDAAAYREQMARVAPFATRVHIDFSDGVFAPVRLVNPIQAYWPKKIAADLHLMVVNPMEHLETVISLRPSLVIIHAESQGDLLGMVRQLRAVGIKTGVALLQKTTTESAELLIADADHILIFSGNLGHFGGQADLGLLKKVAEVRAINANAEVAWDGGVTQENAGQLVFGGVEVLNAGGAIQKAEDPKAAYEDLRKASAVNT